MLAKYSKVPREKISFILNKGDFSTSALFLIRSIKNNHPFSRYRVIISKKISNKAVIRNKLRRQVYESIRLNKSETGNQDIILIPKKNITTANYQEIEKDIWKSLAK